MNIIVTTGFGPSIHSFGNVGDVAMLQACLRRLAELWPKATLHVLTEWPEELVKPCPTSRPLHSAGCDLWIGQDLLLGRYSRFIPWRAKSLAVNLKRKAALNFPAALKWCLDCGLQIRNFHAKRPAVGAFRCTLDAADLIVASGAGGFYEGCHDWNLATLDVLEAGTDRGIPVVMLGQHFGPLTDPEVISRAKRILPLLDLITLRGNPMAWQFLQTIGVSQSRIRVTGDEAIEAAYVERRQELGTQIGVNFRLRTSAETTDCELETVKSVLQQFAAKKRVSFVPVPIAVDSSTSDHRSIMRLLSGVDDETDGGAQLTSPAQVIEQVGHCRILVTCAYHAAVFALAQGIPVIGLAKSPYFTEKFLGLKNQFRLGCEVIQMTATDFSQRLDAAMEFAWASAADIRGQLHQAALRQMKAVCDSYEEVKKIVRQSTQNLDTRERNMTSVIGSIAGKSPL